MTKRLEGKTVVISGAASGIGQASAIRLAAEGARIVIADRDKAEKTRGQIADAGGNATAVQCDISDPASVAKLKEAVEKNGGRCDILVNNAGIYPMQPFDEITFDDWRRVLSVNLNSMFLMTKALTGGMRQRGWGRVINLRLRHRQSPGAPLRPLHHQQSGRHRLYPLAGDRIRRTRRYGERDCTGVDATPARWRVRRPAACPTRRCLT